MYFIIHLGFLRVVADGREQMGGGGGGGILPINGEYSGQQHPQKQGRNKHFG